MRQFKRLITILLLSAFTLCLLTAQTMTASADDSIDAPPPMAHYPEPDMKSINHSNSDSKVYLAITVVLAVGCATGVVVQNKKESEPKK